MKKYIKIICLASIIALIGTPVHAIDFNWGVKGGLNLSGSTFKGLRDNISSDACGGNGFFIGPMGEIAFPIGLSIDGSLLYLQRRSKFTNDLNKESVNFYRHSLDIPLYLKYTFNPFKMFGIYAGVGPSFTFDFKNDNLTDKLYQLAGVENIQANSANLISNEAQIGLNFTLGVVLFKHLRAGVNYRQPLGNSVKETFTEAWSDILGENFSNKNKMWQLVFSVTF